MLKKSFSLIFAIALTAQAWASKPAPRIQIAILLDASGSMNGLINQAQSKLWHLVNDVAQARKHGKMPKLEVALYMYGHTSLPAAEGYIRCLQGLTQDLDAVSEALFKITTDGGEEYCGQAIRAATTLNWSTNPRDYKAIFIAGNEPFNQGPVDFRKVCSEAIGKGIVINTIFCGDEQKGIQTFWQEAANLSDGKYMSLNHNAVMVTASAPQDTEILRLGQELNQTYLGYGSFGAKAKKRQKEQDTNAKKLNEEVAVNRTLAKASPAYAPKSWDLVTATQSGEVSLEGMDDADLPSELKGKTKEEQEAVIEAKADQREQLQKQIKNLEKKRANFLASQASSKGNLDDVMSQTIRHQLEKLKFEFPKKSRP